MRNNINISSYKVYVCVKYLYVDISFYCAMLCCLYCHSYVYGMGNKNRKKKKKNVCVAIENFLNKKNAFHQNKKKKHIGVSI